MTCDPNTLSRLSSCLRCLSDAQLMVVKTHLLCRWLQVSAQSLIVVSTPGGISFQIVVDDLGDLGTVSASGVAQNLILTSTPGGLSYKIIVDDFGNLGTDATVGTGQNIIVKSTPGNISYRIVVDDLGNLGTV